MAGFRHLRKMSPSSLSLSSTRPSQRRFAAVAAALAAPDEFEYYELPLPVLQNTNGQRSGRGPQWVFLGSPGVGKSTYASRLAKLLNVPHISMGNLLRKEASKSTAFASELANFMRQGKLVPDEAIYTILSKRFEQKLEYEESGFIIDGFPRTLDQAEVLDQVADIDLVVNLKLREDILIKHMDRCSCTECGANFCDAQENHDHCSTCKALTLVPGAANMMGYMCLLRDRLKTYSTQCKPVEYHYRKRGKLLDLDVMGGIPQTWPRLLSALQLNDTDMVFQQQLPV